MTEEFIDFLNEISPHYWKGTPKFNVSMEALRGTRIYNYFEVVRKVIEGQPLIGDYTPEDFKDLPSVCFQRASWLSYSMWRDYVRDPWFKFVLNPNEHYVLAAPLWNGIGYTISKRYPYYFSKQEDYWFKTPFELLPEQYMVDFKDLLSKVDDYFD